MSRLPPIPPEQRTFGKVKSQDGHADRRDLKTGLQSGAPGDADANLREQGRFGNLSQNVKSVHFKHQDR